MSTRLETCPRCHDRFAQVAERFEVDARGRLPEHTVVTWRVAINVLHRANELAANGAMVAGPSPERIEERCPGSGRASREEKQRREEARAKSLTALAKAARDDAAVALDAFEAGRPEMSERLEEFKLLALHAYARHFKIRKKIREPWRWEWFSNRTRPTPASKGDLYCVLCGELLLRGVTRKSLGNDVAMPWRHLTRCMLWFLAGMLEPAPPGTKKLPPEFREDQDG